ncbi:UPF0058 family protein [Halobium salinum]|uniref:UPF0058 family protein n=1 Tax=Halobium salinum TaxID=1364940 RepID=A0ABD5P6H9_9EURY|nr:UPF0058 family protein [Halobium salinum]
MNKTELLHLHGLLVTVADDLRDEGVLTVADLEPYFELEVTPVALQASRSDHERAVQTLAAAISERIAAFASDGRDQPEQAVG